MAAKWVVVGLLSSFIAFILNTVAIATPYWLHHCLKNDTAYVGIFRMCLSKELDCGDLGDLYALLDVDFVVWFHISQSFFILGLLGGVFLFVVPLLLYCKFFDMPNWYRPIAAIALLTAAVLIVPVIIIGHWGPGLFVLNSNVTTLGSSYGVAVAALVFTSFASVAFFVQSVLYRRAVTVTTRPIITIWQKPYSVFVNDE